jgi:hypothetical protein
MDCTSAEKDMTDYLNLSAIINHEKEKPFVDKRRDDLNK